MRRPWDGCYRRNPVIGPASALVVGDLDRLLLSATAKCRCWEPVRSAILAAKPREPGEC